MTRAIPKTIALAGALFAMLAAGSLAHAQPGGPGSGMGGMGRHMRQGHGPGGGAHRLIARHLYPPQMVMRFSDDIGITEAQRKAFLKEIKLTQSEVTDLQFAMHAEAGKLSKLVAAKKVDEKKALAQSDRVMTMESKVKRKHLRLLIRIKNLLTAQQRVALDKMKKKMMPLTPPVPPVPSK